MKKFTLIEEDKYIGVDGIGIFFDENNWPSIDIQGLWAIQWRDNGTPEGDGWIEYNTPIPNDPCSLEDIQKYVDHFNKEYDRQVLLKKEQEEQEKKNTISWQQAMQELEEQMEEMQLRHEETLNKMNDEYISADLAKKVKQEYELTLEELQKRHEESLGLLENDHSKQIQKVHDRIAEAHENLFYAANSLQDNIEESKTTFQKESGYDNLTIFEGNIDPSLFDDSIDDSIVRSFFETTEESLLDISEVNQSQLIDTTIRDFSNVDLSLLDAEFNLELMFDEDPTEQVVSEIESLIDETDKENT